MRFVPILIAFLLGGCALAGDEVLDDATLDSMEVSGIGSETIRFVDGEWEGRPVVPGGASRPNAHLLRNSRVEHDFDGDGRSERAVVLSYGGGGSGRFAWLMILSPGWNAPKEEARFRLGDRIQIIDLEVVDDSIVMSAVVHGPEDAACCPTLLRRWIWVRGEGGWTEEVVDGPTLSLAHLDGSRWRLERNGRGLEVGDSLEVTLEIDGDGFAGSTGCNRYGLQVVESGVRNLKAGPIMVTRRACPPEQSTWERELLDGLENLVSYGWIDGRLVLGSLQQNQYETLYFARIR